MSRGQHIAGRAHSPRLVTALRSPISDNPAYSRRLLLRPRGTNDPTTPRTATSAAVPYTQIAAIISPPRRSSESRLALGGILVALTAIGGRSWWMLGWRAGTIAVGSPKRANGYMGLLAVAHGASYLKPYPAGPSMVSGEDGRGEDFRPPNRSSPRHPRGHEARLRAVPRLRGSVSAAVGPQPAGATRWRNTISTASSPNRSDGPYRAGLTRVPVGPPPHRGPDRRS